MNTRNDEFVISFLTGFVLPVLILVGLSAEKLWQRKSPVSIQKSTEWQISVRTDANTADMGLESYVCGVVSAEMPACFELDALKAQAVAARTYARKAQLTGGKHGDGSICTDPGCCQAYISHEQFLEHGGTEADLNRIREAVSDTAGEIVTYQGSCIEATYFSCSGGSTENAWEVWGNEYPYLMSVTSEGERAENLSEDRRFTPEELEHILNTRLDGPPESWFSDWQFTGGGGVASVVIGNRKFDGVTLRSILGLRSTLLTVKAAENEVVIHTEGYGHRVGMSQYGADAMAVRGSAYSEILQYYYPGTVLMQIDEI